MLRFPNCKINIGLYITDRRNDGYHDLETVFYPVQLTDVLEIVPAKEISTTLHITGLEVTGNKEENLVWKAHSILKQQFPQLVPELDIYLHKVIAMGGGLGGGSSDGSFMLGMIRDYCQLPLSDGELAVIALQLGSDCPFFIYNKPCYARGRGEQLTPISLDLSDYSIQLLCPDIHVSTKAAFSSITPKPASFDLRGLATLQPVKWKEYVQNDFEEPVFKMHPVLQELKEELYKQGAIYAAMSGSGATLYGLFEKGRHTTAIDVPGVKSWHVA